MTAQQLAAIRRCEEAQRRNRTAGTHRSFDRNQFIQANETEGNK